ncbi:MAG: proton-conducting transporter membrane subunit [Candidatus Dormibacteraceae bacterium]
MSGQFAVATPLFVWSSISSVDPSTLLPWTAPALLWLPAVGLLMLLAGVRTRRGAFGLSLFIGLLTAFDLAAVSWARFAAVAPLQLSYSWINVTVAFSGDSRWQNFNPAIALQLNHLSLLLLAVLLLIFITAAWWHRLNGRREGSPLRFHAALFLFWSAAVGVVVSADIVLLAAFWLLAGTASFLSLSHRRGSESASRVARWTLALPLVGDFALLGAVALIYSRFGNTNLNQLAVLIGHTPGVGAKSMLGIAALLGLAVVVRVGLWPFHGWPTRSADAPPAAAALVFAVWPLLVGQLLLFASPFFNAAEVRPWLPLGGEILAAIALIGLFLALLTPNLRCGLLLASSGGVAAAMLVLPSGDGRAQAVALSVLLALVAARGLAVLATAHLAASFETVDLRLLGEGWRRMPRATMALGVATAGLLLPLVFLAVLRSDLISRVVMGVGLTLLAVTLGRLWGVVASHRLPYRRAFTPSRIRDAGKGSSAILLVVGVVVLISGGLDLVPSWIGWVAGSRQAAMPGLTELLWLVVPVLGMVVGVVLMRRDSPLTLTIIWAELYLRLAQGLGRGLAHRMERLMPGQRWCEETLLPRLEESLGSSLVATGSAVVERVESR